MNKFMTGLKISDEATRLAKMAEKVQYSEPELYKALKAIEVTAWEQAQRLTDEHMRENPLPGDADPFEGLV